jgi:hypothetical protein
MTGNLVYIRYLDHVLFRHMPPGDFSKPFVRETIGWLDYEDRASIRILWDKADPGSEMNQEPTGLLIVKSGILEMRHLETKFLSLVCEDMHETYATRNNCNSPEKENTRAVKGIRQEGGDLRQRDKSST